MKDPDDNQDPDDDRHGGRVVSEAGSQDSPPGEGAWQRRVTRRRAIGAAGTLGLSTGLAGRLLGGAGTASARGRVVSAARASRKKRLSQWMMIIDLRYCDGCKACTAACQAAHYLPQETEWIKVYTVKDADGGSHHLPKPCMMCEDPPCQFVCPVGATFRNDEGQVLIDQSVCIGCRFCMAACPYESRYFNTKPGPKVPTQPFPTSPQWPVPQVMDTVGKCIFCAARLHAGMLPECVAGCPMGVLYIGDLTTDVAINGLGNAVKISKFLRENDAVRLKEELGTNPRVYYIPGHGQDLKE